MDATKTRIDVPAYGTDKIIGKASGTLSVSAPTGGLGDVTRTATGTHATGFGEACYFRGRFSTDGGSTWNDFGSATPDLSGGFPNFQTTECIAECSSSGIVTVTATNYTVGVAKTVNYEVTFIASNTAGYIKPLSLGKPTFFTSSVNYLKIAQQGQLPWTTTPGVDQTKTITHGLGYVPKIRAFFRETSSGRIIPITNNDIQIDNQVTSSTLTFFLDSYRSGFLSAIAGQIEWRIYLDA